MRDWNVICIFCEDIREEKQGDTLLGIFPDNVNIQAIPGMLPKFGVYTRFHVAVDAKIKNITLKLRMGDGEEVPFGGFEPSFIQTSLENGKKQGSLYSGFIVKGVAAPFVIKSAGKCQMIAKIDDEELVCGSINFQLTPANLDPTVLQPLASQSPPASPAKA